MYAKGNTFWYGLYLLSCTCLVLINYLLRLIVVFRCLGDCNPFTIRAHAALPVSGAVCGRMSCVVGSTML